MEKAMINKADVIQSLNLNSDLRCCGLNELSGLETIRAFPAEVVLLRACLRFANPSGRLSGWGEMKPTAHMYFAHLVFTQAGARNTYGNKLKRLIEKLDLGTVVVSPRQKNPNTGRIIKTFIWTPDKEKVCAYWNNQLKLWKEAGQ